MIDRERESRGVIDSTAAVSTAAGSTADEDEAQGVTEDCAERWEENEEVEWEEEPDALSYAAEGRIGMTWRIAELYAARGSRRRDDSSRLLAFYPKRCRSKYLLATLLGVAAVDQMLQTVQSLCTERWEERDSAEAGQEGDEKASRKP